MFPFHYVQKRLRDYDFELTHWPADYSWQHAEDKQPVSSIASNWRRMRSQHSSVLSTMIFGIPKEVISYLISNSFGISVAYPGSLGMLKAAYSKLVATYDIVITLLLLLSVPLC